ncbi:hypothetical protein QE152_g18030 [Popillia japonica]|uniref:Uncharacterized protein n=1 Tax=Popillia japonica TaxID=7064 RepID=A0AAW1L5I2_POPJA
MEQRTLARKAINREHVRRTSQRERTENFARAATLLAKHPQPTRKQAKVCIKQEKDEERIRCHVSTPLLSK